MNNIPKFDDTIPLFDETEEIDVQPISESQSAIMGASKGLSMGLAPYMEASNMDLSEDINLDPRKSIQEQKAYYNQAQEQNPSSFAAGEIGGSLAMPLSSSKIAGQAAIGAGTGTMTALTEGRISDIPQEAATGAALSGGIGLAGKGISKGAGVVKDYLFKKFPSLAKLGQESALEALAPTSAELEAMGKGSKGFAERARLGKTALDKGLIEFGTNPSRNAVLNTEIAMGSSQINDKLQLLDQVTQFDKGKFLENVTKRFEEQTPLIKGSDMYNKARAEFEDTVMDLIGAESLDKFTTANQLKGFIDKKIGDKILSGTKEAGQGEMEKLAIRRALKDTIMEAADNVNPELKESLGKAYDEYSDLAQLSGIAGRSERTATASASKASQSVADINLGNVMPFLTPVKRNIKVGEAIIGNNIRKTLEEAPEKLGKYANTLSNAAARGKFEPTHYVLMQTDPEYRKMIKGEE